MKFCVCNNNSTNIIPCLNGQCQLENEDQRCYTSLENGDKGCVNRKRCYSHENPFKKPLVECCEGNNCNENQDLRYDLFGMFEYIFNYVYMFVLKDVI